MSLLKVTVGPSTLEGVFVVVKAKNVTVIATSTEITKNVTQALMVSGDDEDEEVSTESVCAVMGPRYLAASDLSEPGQIIFA